MRRVTTDKEEYSKERYKTAIQAMMPDQRDSPSEHWLNALDEFMRRHTRKSKTKDEHYADDKHLQSNLTASSNCSSPSAEVICTPSCPTPACKRDVSYNDHHTAEAEIAIGDYVYGFFYGKWYPATIRATDFDDIGSVQVQWISEWSVSILSKECVVRMCRREEMLNKPI